LELSQGMPSQAILNIFITPSSGVVGAIIIMMVLILLSALMSGSEVAFFSLNAVDREQLSKEKNPRADRVVSLLSTPKKLLATILIANNFINVAIVMVSTFVLNGVVAVDGMDPTLLFLVQVVSVTFIILLLGEVIPKVYATKNKFRFSKFMSLPLVIVSTLFKPFSSLLVSSTSIIDKRIKKRSENISVDDLEHALSLTKESVETDEEKKILEGIVKFGQTDVKQIMTPRLDVVALEDSMSFTELKEAILEAKYSRIPVFTETVDNIKGVLYIKDLLSHLDAGANFNWQDLVREPKFVPENKKLDDLLKEFQEEKKHISVVVDEYGGTSGIVTMEDVLEEIVGDITDEFDDDDLIYSKLDAKNFVFEGKTSLVDMYRVLDIEGDIFEEVKGESDTIAGFCIEQAGKILLKNEKLIFEDYTFTIEAADKRRIKQVKVTIEGNSVISEKGEN